MFQDYKVNPVKIQEAEAFRSEIMKLDDPYSAYKSLKQWNQLPVDYLIYIGMTTDKWLLSNVRNLFREYASEYPIKGWTLADEYCRQRDLSKKDQDLEEREWANWPWKFYICYQKWEYIAIGTKVIPAQPKGWCWRYWISLSKDEDPAFYQFCTSTMKVARE